MMRRLFLALALLLATLAPVRAAVTITQTDIAHSPSVLSTTVTYTSMGIGAAASDRYVFLVLTSQQTNAATLSGATVTIGGVTATLVKAGNNAGTNEVTSYICQVSLAAGTTATVVVTMTGTTPFKAEMTAVTYRVVGADLTTPVSSTASANTTGTGSVSASLTILSGGGAIGGALGTCTDSTTTSAPWTNMTQDTVGTTGTPGATSTDLYTTSSTTTSGTATRTVTMSCAGTISNSQITLAAIQSAAGGSTTHFLTTTGVGQ